MLKKKLKVGKKIEFMLDGKIEKGEIIGIPINGESVAVKYRYTLKTIIKPTDIVETLKT